MFRIIQLQELCYSEHTIDPISWTPCAKSAPHSNDPKFKCRLEGDYTAHVSRDLPQSL